MKNKQDANKSDFGKFESMNLKKLFQLFDAQFF